MQPLSLYVEESISHIHKTFSTKRYLTYNHHLFLLHQSERLRFSGDAFGVLLSGLNNIPLCLCTEGHFRSGGKFFFSACPGVVTSRLASVLLLPMAMPRWPLWRMSAAWMESTRSWFRDPENRSQYTVCSQMCLMKHTLLLYSFPGNRRNKKIYLISLTPTQVRSELAVIVHACHGHRCRPSPCALVIIRVSPFIQDKKGGVCGGRRVGYLVTTFTLKERDVAPW